MRRMIDPTKVGGLPSTIEFDKDGNRSVKKNLGVDGKLTLKSLVSSTNPDGDITKELGGGATIYEYTIFFRDSNNLGITRTGNFYSSVDINQNNKIRTTREIYEQLLPSGAGFSLILGVYGVAKIEDTYHSLIEMKFSNGFITLDYFDPTTGQVTHTHNFWGDTTNTWNVVRNTASPRKA